jgi:S-methylmethionine-dependent homocysteine/selenocysteine methylase
VLIGDGGLATELEVRGHDLSEALWVSAGARIVGGCCRVGPPDIAGIAALAALGR